MIIYQIKIERDSDNSYVDNEFIEMYDNGNRIKLILKNPNREIEISYNDFTVVCEAIKMLKLQIPLETQLGKPASE
jgi:hypothetical protein